MLEKRRHKRFKLDLIELNSRLSLTDPVEIIDMSFGGVALKAYRRLNIGKEYVIKLEDKGKYIDVRGIVVRSKLSGIEERTNGERVSIYTAAMRFQEGAEEMIANFIRDAVMTC